MDRGMNKCSHSSIGNSPLWEVARPQISMSTCHGLLPEIEESLFQENTTTTCASILQNDVHEGNLQVQHQSRSTRFHLF